jgi:3-phenylpropionate/trans-cinnamate dioxygenase ferredoxin reductase subunit
MTTETVVIVGASLAGATAAAHLRARGFTGDVVLVGDEAHRPYERPPLTKQLLRGESEPSEAAVHPPDLYEKESIELRLGAAVERIDRSAGEVQLAGGERLGYDRLLLATGAHPRRLDVPGAALDGVLTLRSVDDTLGLRARLGPGIRLAVVGGGWIGCEAAASARQLGADVTLIEASDVPLGGVLGPRLGSVFVDLHREHGVVVRSGEGVAGFAGDASVSAVEVAGGERVACDVALVGVGVVPATELASAAGLAVSNGIEVDSLLRSSDPAIFAAGDVALAEHPRYGRLRVEHWENARRQGEAAAAAILDQGVAFDAIPYFFSDQYDLGMEYTGLAGPDDELVVRGDLASREFVAFWLRDGRVTAGMNVNVWDVADEIRDLISSGATVDRHRLAAPDVPLAELIDGRR